MLAMILTVYQILIVLRRNHSCLPKVREVKQSETVVVMNKLVSKDLESRKQHSTWTQIKETFYQLFNFLKGLNVIFN